MIDGILVDELLPLLLGGMQETLGGLALALVLPERVGVDALLADETAISLSHSDEHCSLLHEELRSPISHISETLDDEFFARKTLSHSQLSKLILIGEDLPCSVVDSKASSLFSASDTVVLEALAGGNSSVVDVSSAVEFLVLVLDQGHLSFSCADVWSRYIDCGP